MPWKPRSINDRRSPYGAAWQRQRATTLRAEPLCRMCLASGRTVAATVVDHIQPLEDGGTNEQANLQPLCKRCHDAIKTPNDLQARRASDRCEIAIRCLPLDSRLTYGLDCRAVRRALAQEHGFDKAHAVALAAAEGVIRSAAAGQLPMIVLRILTDDAQFARLMAERYGCKADIEAVGSVPSGGDEQEWLARRYGAEYLHRHGEETKGSQPQRA